MLFLPIVDRELRIAARSWRTYYSRVLLGGVALVASFYLIWILHGTMGGRSIGWEILRGTSLVVCVLCLFGGISRTADSISSEKREGTLGFLFLTHLKGYDIVLGKLVANSLSTLFLILAILPVMAVPILLGGVSGAALGRVAVSLFNALLLSVSLGLLVSSMATVQRVASSGAVGILVLLAMVFPACSLIAQRYSGLPWLPMALALPSPTYALGMAFDSSVGLSTNFFWTAIAIQVGISILSLSVASFLVPRLWQTKKTGGWRWRDWLTRISLGDPAIRTARRRRMLDRNPIYWLNCRDRFGPLWPMIFAGVTFAVVGVIVLYWEIPLAPALLIFFAAVWINDFGMRIRVGTIAAVRLAQDRQSGALEMILSTPLKTDEMVRGVWMSIRQKLLWTYVPLLSLIGFGAIIAGILVDVGNAGLVLLLTALSVGEFITIGYVGVWRGMRVRDAQHATSAALLRVTLLPWFLFPFVMSIAYHRSVLKQFMEEHEPYGFILIGIAVWLVSTIHAYWSARRNIALHFREAATDRYLFEQRTSWWRVGRRWSERLPGFNLLRLRGRPVLN